MDIQAEKGLTATRIHQDFKKEFGYSESHDVVKEYLKNTKKGNDICMALNSLSVGSAKKAWVFVMTLSYSRYMYAQIVFAQSVNTFIEYHKNAFKFFKGAPSTVKIDNLKAAIIKTNFYEPTVPKHYVAFNKNMNIIRK